MIYLIKIFYESSCSTDNKEENEEELENDEEEEERLVNDLVRNQKWTVCNCRDIF